MKEPISKTLLSILVILACIFAPVFTGCEGSDAKKAITDMVNKIVGSDVVKKGEEMKKQVDQAMQEEAKRLIKMDKGNKGEASDDSSSKEGQKESEK